jgi:hypothetical protein
MVVNMLETSHVDRAKLFFPPGNDYHKLSMKVHTILDFLCPLFRRKVQNGVERDDTPWMELDIEV